MPHAKVNAEFRDTHQRIALAERALASDPGLVMMKIATAYDAVVIKAVGT